jgi:signal transduction histidine kinase
VLCALSLVLFTWYLGCVFISLEYWRGRVLLTWGYLLIGWIIWTALVTLNPFYLFVLFGLYPQLFVFLRLPWSIVGAGILLGISLWNQVTGQGDWNAGVVMLLSWPASIGLGVFIEALVRQSRERARLIYELQTTRQQLAFAAHQTGIMQERERLAQEIHDTLVQGFTGIVMHLEAAEGALPSEMKTLQRHLDQARRTARENLVEARRLMWALQPAAFAHAALPEVLTNLAQGWTERNAIASLATVTGTARALRPEIEVTLLRAAQEALANTGKHAHASQVILTLSYMEDVVVLDVQDDGDGFDPTHLLPSPAGETASRFGLQALRKRVEQLGGTLSLESAPGEGTTLAVALPAIGSTWSPGADAAPASGL